MLYTSTFTQFITVFPSQTSECQALHLYDLASRHANIMLKTSVQQSQKQQCTDFLSSASQKSAQSINKVHAMFPFSMVQIMFSPLAPLAEISSMSLI